MRMAKTERGFALTKFTDRYDVPCSLQESSLACEPCIWFGADEIGLKRFEPDGGWIDIELEDAPGGVTYQANTRMHLTQEMVRDLLPALQHFAETGNLPEH